MTPEEYEYSEVREYAQHSLTYVWKTFDRKTNDIFNLLKSPPFSNMSLEGSDENQIDLNKIISHLEKVKLKIFNMIDDITTLQFENRIDKEFTQDDRNEIFIIIGKAKTIQLKWFQAFFPNSNMNRKKLQSIHNLWRIFYQENLWIRSYQNDPTFRSAKQMHESNLINWMKTNEKNLLFSFEEMILSINTIRNTTEHWEEDFYASHAQELINESLSDPLTDVEETSANSYTTFISISNQITALLSSFQIFCQSIKICQIGGVDQSEKSTKNPWEITCSNCAQIKIIPFKPKTTHILCNECLWEKEDGLIR
jgi:hypothetical protein